MRQADPDGSGLTGRLMARAAAVSRTVVRRRNGLLRVLHVLREIPAAYSRQHSCVKQVCTLRVQRIYVAYVCATCMYICMHLCHMVVYGEGTPQFHGPVRTRPSRTVPAPLTIC